MVVGFIAMGSPYVFSILIAQRLGIAAVVIGLQRVLPASSGSSPASSCCVALAQAWQSLP